MSLFCRREFREVVEVVCYDDSDSSSSSDDEHIAMLVCHVAFPPKPLHQKRICLDDLSGIECEQLFR